MAFERLLAAAPLAPDLRDAIEDLLAQKRAGTEQDAGPRLPVIHAFIDAELERQAALQFPEGPERPGTEPLNTVFRAVFNAPTSRVS